MAKQRKWINFARYTSPPIGKARQMEVTIDPGSNTSDCVVLPAIYMRILMDDGHEYEGWLKQMKEDEEE